MSENSSDESIESIVAERLDRIFGDDEEAASTPPAPTQASLLSKMQEAVETLNKGVTPYAVDNLASEAQALGKSLGKDPLFRPLLKITGLLTGTLKTGGEAARLNAMKTMTSVFHCMKTLAEDDSLPVAQKRILVQRQIEAYKAFRESIQEKPSAPQAKAPAGPLEKPMPKPKPAPSPVETPKEPDPEPSPAPSPVETPKEPEPEPSPAPPPVETPKEPEPEPSPAPSPAIQKEDPLGSPEAKPRTPETGLSQEALGEFQSWIGEALSHVKDQIQEVKATLPDVAETPAKKHEDLARIATHIKGLSGVPQSLKTLQTQMLKALVSLKKSIDALPNHSINAEPLRKVVSEEVTTLRQALEPVLQVPSRIEKLEKETHDTLTRIDDKVSNLQREFDTLRQDIRGTRLDLNRLRSFARGSNETVSSGDTGHCTKPPEKEDGLSPDSPYGHWEWEEIGNNGQADKGIAEEAPVRGQPFKGGAEPSATGAANEKVLPESQSLPSGQYFLFYTGGRKYAVDARYVVKATRIGGAVSRKARSKGSLTLAEAKPVLSNPRKGIEPHWEKLSDEEIKQTAYELVSDDTLDGLAATNGAGVLFLETGEKALLILSDEPAVKITLTNEDEIQMSTASATSQSATCGSIQRSGEGTEFYLILAPECLAERIT